MEVSGQLHAPAALPPGKEPLDDVDNAYRLPKQEKYSGIKETQSFNATLEMYMTIVLIKRVVCSLNT
jgi:hypothetical protein